MNQRIPWAIGHGVLLLVVLFGVMVLSGYWAIPLAFGPTAYYLVLAPHDSINSPQQVLVSHLLALLVGGGTYLVVAPGIAPTAVEPLSDPAMRIVLSMLISYTILTGLFIVLDIRHLMAYVTAFVAALGALSTLRALTAAILTLFLVSGVQTLRREIGPEFSAQPAL